MSVRSDSNPRRRKLKPCPFCGRQPISKDGASYSRNSWIPSIVQCTHCCIPIVERKTRRGAELAWNRRVQNHEANYRTALLSVKCMVSRLDTVGAVDVIRRIERALGERT